jgi:phage-related baseplate assembly protein
MALADPQFIETDPNPIVTDSITFFETQTGSKLSQAQPERLLINNWSYREALLRSGINDAAKSGLVAYASGVNLDYLAQLVGVSRLPEQPAETTIEFLLVTGHAAVVIPQGTRVASQDGKVVFYTLAATPVGVGVDDITVLCRCETAGTAGNGYIATQISVILDPQAYIASAENISTTVGGADVESDEQLRVRIFLAPERYSTAGSEGGYEYFARSSNQAIVDVKAFSSAPGVISIYPLTMDTGGTPAEILADVEAAVSPEKVRPLNDTVNVISPTAQNYAITIDLVLYEGADQAATLAQVQAAVEAYKDGKRKQLGRDIIIDQIKAISVIKDAVYKANVISPVADIVIDNTKYPECSAVTINVTGLNNG